MQSAKFPFQWILSWHMIILTYVIFLTGCSSTENQYDLCAENKRNTEYTELMQTLEEYSLQFSISHPSLSRADAGWSDFKEAVKADYVSGSDGRAGISIGASRKKWKELKRAQKEEKLKNCFMSPQQQATVKHQIDSLKLVYLTDTTNLGAIHNATILQSLLDKDLYFDNTEELVKSVRNALQKLGFETSNFDVKTTTREIDNFFATIYDTNISVMYERLTTKYPERKEEFQILNHYLSTIETLTNIEDIIEFSQEYINIINQSKISHPSKKTLRSNISIAPASHQLWQEIDDILD